MSIEFVADAKGKRYLNDIKNLIKERGLSYGSADLNMETVATYWTTYLNRKGVDVTLTGLDVANMMILLKINRSCADPKLADNHKDIRGYSYIHSELENKITKEE